MRSPAYPGKINPAWAERPGVAHDANVIVDDWSKLDEYIARLPSPERDADFEACIAQAEKARREDRYVLFCFWRLFFERPWCLRGMENLMVDYYTEPENVHRLNAALCDTYCAYIAHAANALGADGFMSSDDLGHQTGPMMSPELFREFLLPYYRRVGAALKKHGMHFWLHSCGDNTLLLPHLVDAGLNVFHPVQKHTMDAPKIAAEFGDRLTFLAGMDVQHALQEEDPDGVREEVRLLIDTFDRPDGGMCIAAGNGIMAGTPFENIEAYLDEAARYGREHRKKYGAGCARAEGNGGK